MLENIPLINHLNSGNFFLIAGPCIVEDEITTTGIAVRVKEITEDYPWVGPAMESLGGQVTIPCSPADLQNRWISNGTLEEVRQTARTSNKLGPRQIEKGASGLIQDLTNLGILQPLPDGRLQMPDVYRVAFGLGRKGGVKPLR